jgi:hypothetical protein
MQVYGMTAEVAAILLVGGILAFGLGGVIGSLDAAPPVKAWRPEIPAAAVAVTTPAVGAAVVATAEAVSTAALASEELSPAVSETIKALEKAKTDLRSAFDEKPAVAEPEPEPEEAEPPEEEAAAEEEVSQLYVLEERAIRGRPARILSDGTVEAETSEGWMRFENLEHLDEYLDAMEPQA